MFNVLMGKARNIFVSYRQKDSADVTGRIYDSLCAHFGKKNIFKDVDNIPFGIDFRKYLDQQVGECKILLAVIGPNWVHAKDNNGKLRLYDDDDFVRIEIESALKRNIPVIPLLVKGASIPIIQDLPESIHELTYRQAVAVRTDPDFHNDMSRLIKSLELHFKKSTLFTNKHFLWGVIGALLIASIIFWQPWKVTSEKKIFQKAKKENSINAYEHFINTFPSSELVTEAKQNIKSIKLEDSLEQAKIMNNGDYNAYLVKYPNGLFVKQARLKLDSINKISKTKENLSTEVVFTNPKTSIDQEKQFIDSRDGKIYSKVTIGNQTWMAENLAYKPTSGNYWLYNDLKENISYGYLYDWYTARKVCPNGWRLPSVIDFNTLFNNYGGMKNIPKNGNALMPGGQSGFSAMLYGWRYVGGKSYNYNSSTVIWTDTQAGPNNGMGLFIDKNGLNLLGYQRANGMYVRCIKDN